MEKHKALFLLLCIVFLNQACATQIPQERIANADYGPPPSAGYEEKIKEKFNQILIDPTSPIYNFGKPTKGYTRKSPLLNTQENFGWKVCGTVNSKNRFGGYAGRIPFFALFYQDRIVAFLYGEIDDKGLSIMNNGIKKACMR
jgi:hypothetical protein